VDITGIALAAFVIGQYLLILVECLFKYGAEVVVVVAFVAGITEHPAAPPDIVTDLLMSVREIYCA
jgi:hypothetical protein